MTDNESSHNVCLITPFPPTRGGVADYSEALAEELANDVDLSVISYGSPNNEHFESYSVYRIEKSDWNLPCQVAKFVNKLDPDIINVQTTMFSHPRRFFLFPEFIDSTLPIIVTAHEVPGLRQFHVLPFQKILYRRADLCIAHTQNVGNKLLGYRLTTEDDLTKVPHGAPCGLFSHNEYDPPTPPQILFFGFLRPGKGVPKLINAFEGLKEKGSDAELVLAGGLPSSDKRYAFGLRSTEDFAQKIRHQVNSSPWSEYIRLTGYVPEEEIPRYFTDASIVVFPYEGSAQSGPLHIALAAGRPIVAHDVGGFSEILTNEETGILYSPNTVAELERTLKDALEDPDRLSRLATQALEKSESISWEKIAIKTIEKYNSVL